MDDKKLMREADKALRDGGVSNNAYQGSAATFSLLRQLRDALAARERELEELRERYEELDAMTGGGPEDPDAPVCLGCGDRFRKGESYGGYEGGDTTLWFHFECAGNWWRDRALKAERELEEAKALAIAARETAYQMEQERDEAQMAHDHIGTLCFNAGASTPDGTSSGAVRDLVAKLDEARQEVDRLTGELAAPDSGDRLLLNSYGRRCYDAGKASGKAEGQREMAMEAAKALRAKRERFLLLCQKENRDIANALESAALDMEALAQREETGGGE